MAGKRSIMAILNRCKWANPKNPLYLAYHDTEWGVPCHDDQMLYELLILESFQAGLSWECVLNKRQAFREAYDNFDISKVANYDEVKLAQLANNPAIIRNKLKIKASVTNSQVFSQIQQEFGSFNKYIWSFTNGKTLIIDYTSETTSALSDQISKDLKKHGMKFVGSTIIYSYLQATGIINGHGTECDLCQKRSKTI